jgi:hypothetical protein
MMHCHSFRLILPSLRIIQANTKRCLAVESSSSNTPIDIVKRFTRFIKVPYLRVPASKTHNIVKLFSKEIIDIPKIRVILKDFSPTTPQIAGEESDDETHRIVLFKEALGNKDTFLDRLPLDKQRIVLEQVELNEWSIGDYELELGLEHWSVPDILQHYLPSTVEVNTHSLSLSLIFLYICQSIYFYLSLSGFFFFFAKSCCLCISLSTNETPQKRCLRASRW